MKLFIFLILTTLFLSDGFAQMKAKANPYSIGDLSVSTENFLSFLRAEAASTFCAKESYFTKCFNSADVPCPKETERQIDQCRNNLRLPASFDSTEIETYSEKIGACVGANLEKKWVTQKKRTRECRQRY